ncbi:hypothetical protein G7046_g2935 [Stylonectria norvegica]|nr:hypothetical protein G7046_g2935 [Stylonectria norvegica]
MRAEPLETTLRRLRDLGYTSIELAGEPTLYPIPEALRLLKKYDIKCWGAVTIQYGSRDLIAADAQQRRDSIQYVKDVVTMAAALGGQIVTVVPSTVGKLKATSTPENEWKWAVEGLREIAAFAQDKNIRIALEPLNRLETYFLNRSDQALALADEVGYDCGIAFDVFHLSIEEKDMFAAIRACHSRIVDFHVGDNNRLAPGDGSFNWPKIMATLAETGYEGAISVEFMPPIDRSPLGKFGTAQLEKDPVDIAPEQLQFIIDHGSGLFSEAYYAGLLKRSAETLLPLILDRNLPQQKPWRTTSTDQRIRRPSNSRIKQLEDENSKLRETLSLLKVRLNESQTESGSINGHTHKAKTSPEQHYISPESAEENLDLTNATVVERSESCGDRKPLDGRSLPITLRRISIDRDSRFHGPSSAMFDEGSSISKGKVSVGQVDIYAKNELLSEATRQRQLEPINMKTHKLDFDGVDPDFGMHLLTVFWNRQHHSGPLVYRPTFMRDMACNGPYFSKLLLNSIYFVATKHSSPIGYAINPDDEGKPGSSYRRKVEAILHDGAEVMVKSEITTIQALLILSDSLFTWCDERSLSWHYSGVAINMITDLGLHSEGSLLKTRGTCKPVDLEVQRRVFWAAFGMSISPVGVALRIIPVNHPKTVSDKAQSVYQGRPARLREADNLVPIRFLDEYDELEEFHTLAYSDVPGRMSCPSYSVSAFGQLCKLSIIMDRILCGLYAEKSSTKNPEELLRASHSLHADLKHWRDALPPHLNIRLGDVDNSIILPHVLSLMAMYNSLVILLHRPFVSDGHLQSVSASAATDSFTTCAAAASEIHSILQLYKSRYAIRAAPYFVSYATYVSATIHLRIAAQRSPGSEAHRCLRNCLEVLSEHQIKCRAPRRATNILLGLMKRLGVEVSCVFATGGTQPILDIPNVTDCDIPRGLALEASLPQVDAQTHLVAGQHNANEALVDFDTTMQDLDIDAIMKSFDLVTDSLSRSLDTNGDIAADDPNYSFGSGQMEEVIQGGDLPLPFDLLFGMNFPFGGDEE